VVLGACLNPDPARRPGSAGVLATALDRFVRRRRGRGRRAAALAVLALIAIAVPFGIRLWPQPVAVVPEVPRPDLMTSGRKALRAGDLAMARADFFAAHRQTGDAKALALAAYCLALEGQAASAAAFAEEAIRGGADSAEVYNTRGFALTQTNQYPAAIAALDAADSRSPNLPAVRYNRALARFRPGLGDKTGVDPRAADDIRAVLAAGLSSLELHFDAARIFAACSARDPALRAAAVEQVRAAIRAGKDPTACERDAVLRTHLRGDPGFLAACATPRGVPPSSPPQLRLVEPYP
jgi:eukaryotic-like serine/threonine-protein kinase